MGLFETLQDLMLKYHFRPDKQLSQFFCINEALLQYLVNSSKMEKGDVVLEIGPGTGFLTKRLLAQAKKVDAKIIAFEVDELMIELLKEEFSEEISSGLFNLINGNVLEQDMEALGINKIVSLPPYHISSDLLTKIGLTNGLKRVILVLDKGFSQKLLAFEGLTEYVALTVLINLNAKLEVLENVIEQSSFFPVPNCISTVIQLDFDVKNNSIEFYTFLRELFRHKNKDLQRSLKQSFSFLSKKLSWKEKDFDTKIKSLKLAQKKVYSLSPQELLEVFNHMQGKGKESKTVVKKTVIKEKKIKEKK